MSPREFLALALELASADSPAKRRTAISRAYYSAFHVGAETPGKLGFRISRGAAGHGEVAHCLANCGDENTAEAARRLSNLHSLRNRADYQLDKTDIEQADRARGAAAQGQSIIDAFDRILTSPHRAQIQGAIAVWRKSNGYP